MKIAVIHLNLSLQTGDPRMTYLLASNIQKAGHHVVIYTAKYDPLCFPELHQDLVVKEIKSPIGDTVLDRSAFQKVVERLRRERLNTEAVKKIASAMDRDFDIVIPENDQSYKLGKFYRAFNPKAKFIWVMNNAPFRHTPKNNSIVNILSWMAGRMERVRVRYYISLITKVVVHDEEQKILAKEIGLDTQLLPIPINFEKFYRPVSYPGHDTPTLLGVGSLSPARSYEDIISAGILLRKKGIDCRVVLICKDIWKDAALRKKLIDLSRTQEDGSWIDFRFDGVSDEELFKMQAVSFAFIFPNHIKIWGMAAFEGMAAGLPLIVSDSTSVAEVLKDGDNALFVRSSHPEEIAAKVSSLFDQKIYESIARNGQDFVKKNLNWGEYITNFLKI
jgi:glycosyltransferase involved in cell wall biosynthesis